MDRKPIFVDGRDRADFVQQVQVRGQPLTCDCREMVGPLLYFCSPPRWTSDCGPRRGRSGMGTAPGSGLGIEMIGDPVPYYVRDCPRTALGFGRLKRAFHLVSAA
jgi:hypothetical protein